MSALTHSSAPRVLDLNPITVEVIGSALNSIVDEMGEALVRASHSTNIKERRDCSTALFDADGNTMCQAEHIPIHLGSFIGLIPQIMKRHSVANMRPGDVFVGNDAYQGGGTHLPDIVLAEPIFIDGVLTAWAVNLAHHADFVDRGHAHIYQEGLRIPPVHLYREGILQQDVMDLMLLNCQVPAERIADLRAQRAANKLGVERMVALAAKYGRNVVMGAAAALQDYAERKMRAGIAKIPNGTYAFSDVFDSPEWAEPIKLSVKITVSDEEVELAFDAPPQTRSACNATFTALLATVYYTMKGLVDPTIIPNAGLARPLRVSAPLGSVLNCAHPAAVDGRLNPLQRVVDIIHGALSQALPDVVPAASNGCGSGLHFIGQRENGDLWVSVESIGGGAGARPTKDGLDGIHVHLTNTSNLPAEALELEYPLTLLRYELIDGSGGNGRFRGGMGIRRAYRADAACLARFDVSRVASNPWGLSGGGEGGRTVCRTSNDSFVHGTGNLQPGDWIEIETPGGGGHGNPAKREPEALARDLREGTFLT
jgi:N-methylhydantoinase B